MEGRQLGYISEETLEELFQLFHKANPEQGEAVLKEQCQNIWKLFSRDAPKGHHLTKDDFVKNMWVTVNQPNFAQEVEKLGKMTFERADRERKGYITKEEYVKMNAHFVSEEQATAMFNAIDTDSKGKFTCDDLVRAVQFFYTDLSDESSPINLMHGPLE